MKKRRKIKTISKHTDKKDKLFLIPVRYLILLGLMFILPLIYKIFTPLTTYPVLWLLKLFLNNVSLNYNVIIINQETFIEMVSSCIAGSAYLLLLIINLAVPMQFKKRLCSIALSFLILLVLNILRIFFLSLLYYNNASFFNFTHKLFWYALSTIFVVGIWFLMVKIFSIKEIPIYSDLKNIYLKIKQH